MPTPTPPGVLDGVGVVLGDGVVDGRGGGHRGRGRGGGAGDGRRARPGGPGEEAGDGQDGDDAGTRQGGPSGPGGGGSGGGAHHGGVVVRDELGRARDLGHLAQHLDVARGSRCPGERGVGESGGGLGGGGRAGVGIGCGEPGCPLPQRLRDAGWARGDGVDGQSFPGEHRQGDASDGVEVGARVGFGAGPGLGRDVPGRPARAAGPGEAGALEVDGDAEVAEVEVWSVGTGRAQEQVGRLDVAVDDPGPVDGDEGVEELAQELGGEARRQRSVVADEGRDRPAVDDRHREQDAVVLTGPAERGEDVRVGDAHGLLAHEAQQRHGVGLAQHLGGDDPVLAGVPDPPDRPHAPLADEVDELVAAREDLTHGRRPGRPPAAARRGRGRSSRRRRP